MSDFTDAVLANAEAMRKAQEKIARLEARIAEVERERDEARRHSPRPLGDWFALSRRAEAAEARIAELERERDELRQKRDNVGTLAVEEAIGRSKAEARCEDLEAELTEWRTSIATEALQARCEALTAALREIDGFNDEVLREWRMEGDTKMCAEHIRRIARAALATSEQARTEEGA